MTSQWSDGCCASGFGDILELVSERSHVPSRPLCRTRHIPGICLTLSLRTALPPPAGGLWEGLGIPARFRMLLDLAKAVGPSSRSCAVPPLLAIPFIDRRREVVRLELEIALLSKLHAERAHRQRYRCAAPHPPKRHRFVRLRGAGLRRASSRDAAPQVKP